MSLAGCHTVSSGLNGGTKGLRSEPLEPRSITLCNKNFSGVSEPRWDMSLDYPHEPFTHHKGPYKRGRGRVVHTDRQG